MNLGGFGGGFCLGGGGTLVGWGLGVFVGMGVMICTGVLVEEDAGVLAADIASLGTRVETGRGGTG